MLVTKVRSPSEEVRSQREKDHQARSPSKTLHLVLTASQPHFPLCQFSS
ncbi:hypothetical protein QUA00_04130 [Microcoleus sp. T2B6]